MLAREAAAFDPQIPRPHRWPIENFERRRLELLASLRDPFLLSVAVSAMPHRKEVDQRNAAHRAQPHFVCRAARAKRNRPEFQHTPR